MRISDWQNKLTEVIYEARGKAFDFSNHNCLFFALKAIDAQTERSLFEQYKDAASSPEAAAKFIRKNDKVKTCQEVILKHLKRDLQPIALAKPGDIVFLNSEREDIPVTQVDLFGPTPGVCYGIVSYFLGEHDLVEIPTLKLDCSVWVS